AVVATIANVNYTGSATGTLVVSPNPITAVVRHAPTLDGDLDGTLQILSPETLVLDGRASVGGDILVPGMPSVQVTGRATLVGTRDGTGSATPSNYQVTLSDSAMARYVFRRTDAIALPTVTAPLATTNTRDVTLGTAPSGNGNGNGKGGNGNGGSGGNGNGGGNSGGATDYYALIGNWATLRNLIIYD